MEKAGISEDERGMDCSDILDRLISPDLPDSFCMVQRVYESFLYSYYIYVPDPGCGGVRMVRDVCDAGGIISPILRLPFTLIIGISGDILRGI